MKYLICTICLVNFSVLFVLSQESANSDKREIINIKDFRIIDKASKDSKVYEFINFYKLINEKWHTQAYLNEYDGVNETRLYRGKSFLQKEALEQNYLGNSAIFDDSIILVGKRGVRFYVGMPISVVKQHYPVSYEVSQNFSNDENKNLRKMSLVGEVIINGQRLPNDEYLTLIYDNDSGKVGRIYSKW
jgi:hypothetical protein